jgi:hypothetical protein
MKRLLRGIARTLLWPIRQFFDPRFQGVVDRIDASRDEQRASIRLQQETQSEVTQLYSLMRTDMEATSEAVTLIGRSLRDIESSLHAVQPANDRETIPTAPFVFRGLANIPRDGTILGVGTSDSSLYLSLATIGYRVTAVGNRPSLVSHPNFRVVRGTIQGWEGSEAFQATVCLSAGERIGAGAIEEGPNDVRADLDVMHKLRDLTEVGGRLILSTSYRRSRGDSSAPSYDRRSLDKLLEGWEIDELLILARENQSTWVSVDPTQIDEEARQLVALVAATRLP